MSGSQRSKDGLTRQLLKGWVARQLSSLQLRCRHANPFIETASAERRSKTVESANTCNSFIGSLCGGGVLWVLRERVHVEALRGDGGGCGHGAQRPRGHPRHVRVEHRLRCGAVPSQSLCEALLQSVHLQRRYQPARHSVQTAPLTPCTRL